MIFVEKVVAVEVSDTTTAEQGDKARFRKNEEYLELL